MHHISPVSASYMAGMRNKAFILVVITLSLIAVAWSAPQVANVDLQEPIAQPTPSNKFTAADIATLKWIEGTWRGMDGDKPFYERYKIEETSLVVEGLKADGSLDGEPGRFELKYGEFGQGEGNKRSAASEITTEYVQFVPPVGGKMNRFRFERQSNGTWRAVLEWPATAEKPARQKIYVMEPWKP